MRLIVVGFVVGLVVGSSDGLISFTVTIVGVLVLNRDSFGVVVCTACVDDGFVRNRCVVVVGVAVNAGNVNRLYVTGDCVKLGILFFFCDVVDEMDTVVGGGVDVFRMSSPCVDGDFDGLFDNLFTEIGRLMIVSAFVPTNWSGLFVVIELNEDGVPFTACTGLRVDDNELSVGREPVDCFVGCDELANLLDAAVLCFVGVVDADEYMVACFVGAAETVVGRFSVST